MRISLTPSLMRFVAKARVASCSLIPVRGAGIQRLGDRKGGVSTLRDDKEIRREEAPAQANRPLEDNSFDDLAMELADGTLTRSRLLKYIGAAILGILFGGGIFGTPVAEARRHRR